MIDAISAGKDVYVEKPASNTVPRINAMLDAYNKGKQWCNWERTSVVGTTSSRRRRLWTVAPSGPSASDHCAAGSYSIAKEAEQPVPAGLDWAMWQGPARRRRLSRAAFDSAAGTITAAHVADWGAHHVDVRVVVHECRWQGSPVTMANGARFMVPDADSEQVPDTFSISWKFDNS